MNNDQLYNELINQGSGLMAASDGVESPFLRVRMLKAAEIMLKAARRIKHGPESFVPEFIKKDAASGQ